MAKHYPMQQLPEREVGPEDARYILEKGEFAVMSTVDADGAPYGFPVSYVMMDDRLFIHTGTGPGHKFENFAHDDRVSVTVAIDLKPLYENTYFTTGFASVVGSGRISKVEDSVTIRRALVALCMKYVPESKHEIGGAIEREWGATTVWAVDFDEIRAKAGHWEKA